MEKPLQIIVIPGRLPGMNEIIDQALNNRNGYGRFKKENTELVAWCAKKIEPFQRAYLDITWYESTMKRDKDNIAAGKKFICDGLQLAGKIKNDGWAQIAGFTDSYEVDRKNPRIEIVIRRV